MRGVFNPVKPELLVVAVGRVLRAAADADAPPDDYRRSQLLSAYSITRNLAAEQAAAPALLLRLRARLDELLAADRRPAVRTAAAAVDAATDPTQIGEALVVLLADLRATDPDGPLRQHLQRTLGQLADDEVAALAAGPPRIAA